MTYAVYGLATAALWLILNVALKPDYLSIAWWLVLIGCILFGWLAAAFYAAIGRRS
jgi:hypothetical protein